MPIITPTVENEVTWKDLREGIRDCIKEAAPTAVVYSTWPLKYDIGDTINLLTSNADNGKVHAWIIGVNSVNSFEDKVGGYQLKFDLNIRIWGFVGYDQVYSGTTQDVIEEEVIKITRILYANRTNLKLTNLANSGEIGVVDWQDIDVHGFGGDGHDVHVAQGNLNVVIREQYSGY
jgi:hypothetical protein